MSPDTLTTVQAAALLRISPRRVRQLKDEIGYAMHGRSLVFERADVIRYGKANGYGGLADGKTADGGGGS